MDPQDKKTKDYSILGQAEDRAISHAKYKREMGINPKYKTEQNVEVSRSAKSMKNPTDRPYDVKTSPKGSGKSVDSKASKAVSRKNNGAAGGQGFQAFGSVDQDTPGTLLGRDSPLGAVKRIGSTLPDAKKRKQTSDPVESRRVADFVEKSIYGSNANLKKKSKFEDSVNNPVLNAKFLRADTLSIAKRIKESKGSTGLKRKASGTYTKPSDVKEPSKTEGSKSAPGKTDKKASDKSRLAPKMTNFQRMKARQFEKEGVAGRSMTAAQAKRKATEKGSSIADLRKLFGLSRVQKAAPGKKSLSSEFAKKNLAANQKIGKSR